MFGCLRCADFRRYFPRHFFEGKRYERGILLIGFPFLIQIDVYENLSPEYLKIDQPFWQDGKAVDVAADRMIFVDSIANTTEPFINTLYETIGAGNYVIGGGAGTLDFVQRPCLFARAGLLANAALVVKLPVPLRSAVDHGWEVLDGPYLVSEANGAKVNTRIYILHGRRKFIVEAAYHLAWVLNEACRHLKVLQVHGLLDGFKKLSINVSGTQLMIIALGDNLDIEILAEDVEAQEELICLQELGCQQYQGYYFSRPVPFENLLAMLHQPQVEEVE